MLNLNPIQFILLALTLSNSVGAINIKILDDVCIKPFKKYHYHTCHDIIVQIDTMIYKIPKDFETDLASIPRFAWSILSPAHSSIIRAAIIHDWFYKNDCDFSRYGIDLIFYQILLNDGIGTFRATIMFYAVRMFGWNYFKRNLCHEINKRR